MKTKTNKAKAKITLHTETETLFIISPCYRPGHFFYPGSKKRTLDYKSIIQVAGVIVNEKRAQISPEICKKERIFMLFREVVLLFSCENQ
jgi:hypothetical protein